MYYEVDIRIQIKICILKLYKYLRYHVLKYQ
jgi:hypothetical protein